MKVYKYIYAETANGRVHTQLEHDTEQHKEDQCYVLKTQAVSDLTPEEVEIWQQKLKEKQDKDNEDVMKDMSIDYVQLDIDYNAWLSKRQMELYRDASDNIAQRLEDVLEHDTDIPESVAEMLQEYLESDK